jgi:hypothetical protein
MYRLEFTFLSGQFVSLSNGVFTRYNYNLQVLCDRSESKLTLVSYFNVLPTQNMSVSLVETLYSLENVAMKILPSLVTALCIQINRENSSFAVGKGAAALATLRPVIFVERID